MHATKKSEEIAIIERLAVDVKGLQVLLGCGRSTAEKIGSEAGAKMQIGKRVLWNVSKVRNYLDIISTNN